MRIILDVSHPADIHLFRNFYNNMILRGHNILITARAKEVSFDLLKAYSLPFISYGRNYKSKIGKLIGVLKNDFSLFLIAVKFKPDIFFSHGSFYAAHVSSLLRKPFITFEDTGNMEQIYLYKFFANVIISPASFKKSLGKNHIKFNGTKELAYIYPRYFNPDIRVLSEMGVNPDENFVIIRFVSWTASHDLGSKGISYFNKIKLIESLKPHAKIFISSESELPPELRKFQLPIKPEKMLDALFYATLFYGESATMTAECGLMGTPAIFVNNSRISYTQELEKKYGLVFNYTESENDQESSIIKAEDLIKNPNLKQEWEQKSKVMMEHQINLTNLMLWLIENYPGSLQEYKSNPGIQYSFK